MSYSKIVIIDDNLDYLNALEKLLSSKGYQNLCVFSDAQEGLEELLKNDSDMLILDIHMPGMNGIQLLMELKKYEILVPSFPILAVSGDFDPGIQDTVLALGTLEYMTKPFRSTEVLLRVGNLLKMRQLYIDKENYSIELESKVELRTKDLHDAYLDTVYRLARAAEFRDDDTGKHILRVGEMAQKLTAQISGTEDLQQKIFYAAQLHDIGKIGVKDSILLKNDKLSASEFDHIKTHTTIGFDILKGSSSELLELAAEIAISHHEKWDGSGYPNRLSGDSIPLSGRITAIADVFDALTHERPYKRAWSKDEAVQEITVQRGKMFDPEIVDAFVHLYSNTSASKT